MGWPAPPVILHVFYVIIYTIFIGKDTLSSLFIPIILVQIKNSWFFLIFFKIYSSEHANTRLKQPIAKHKKSIENISISLLKVSHLFEHA